MNTVFLGLYKVENLAPEIGNRFNLKFSGTAFTEVQPEFHLNVESGSELLFNRCLFQYDTLPLPVDLTMAVEISSNTLIPFTTNNVLHYEANEDNDYLLEIIPTGFPPSSKIKLFFKKYSRLKFINRNYIEEFALISDCLSKILMWRKQINDDPQSSQLFDELRNELQNLYNKINPIGQTLGLQNINYNFEAKFEYNFEVFVNQLSKIQKHLNCEKSFTKLNEFSLAFDSFLAKFNQLKSYLAGININPCTNNNLPENIWGELYPTFKDKLNCICDLFELDGNLPNGIQGILNLLKTKADLLHSGLNNFIESQKNSSFNPGSINFSSINYFDHISNSNGYCEKFYQITAFLEWIENNKQYLIDVPPNTLETIIANFSNEIKNIKVIFEELQFSIPNLCKHKGEGEGEYIVQSSYIYLQACGADNTVDYLEGVHLRWSLLGEIGDNHIPKGNLANNGNPYYSNYGYNKEDDFVVIEKTPYEDFAITSINFTNTNPKLIKNNSPELSYIWVFPINSFTSVSNQKFFNEVNIKFLDKPKYDLVRTTIDPTVNALDFLKSYSGIIEINLSDKLMFSWKFELENINNSNGSIKYEAINNDDLSNKQSKRITIRKTESGSTFDVSDIGENICSLRLKFENGCFIKKLHLESYADFNDTRSDIDWSNLGNFGLTTDDNEAFNRLDGNGTLAIDNEWPKFNDGIKIKTENYENKWTDINNGLKSSVINYLELSKNDTKANALLESQDSGDLSKLPFSYLDILQLNSLDYHNARMLGLAHIDTNASTQKFIYRATYKTNPLLISNRAISLTKHYFLSLPTDKSDIRLPLTPELDDLTYGLEGLDECTLQKMQDENGYSLQEDIRFINIKRKKYNYEIPFSNFFEQNQEFDIAELALPVFYGLKHKDSNNNFLKPDLVNNPDYLDYNSSGNPSEVNETLPLIDTGAKLHTQLERTEGIHKYSIFGINWFSRATQISNDKETDNIDFSNKKRILAPNNIHVHYIQKEENLIFTTQSEQDALATRIQNNPNGDNCYTRVTFNWNHIHQINYPDADTVEFYYKNSSPIEVEGKVEKTTSLGNGLYDVYSKSYTIVSKKETETISPTLSANDYNKFIGSKLLTKEGQFSITSIRNGTNGPIFTIKAEINTGKTLNNDGNRSAICTPVYPLKESIFQAIENLSNDDNWNKLSKEVSIIKHSTHSETIDGKTVEIGGIFGDAKIYSDAFFANPGEAIDGLFKIVFENQTLSDHPQSGNGVSWSKGSARVKDSNNSVHELEVWHIENGTNLAIWAFDHQYVNNGNYNYLLNDSNNTNITEVNFHPGYKVYLEPENSNNFNQSNILPSTDNRKENYLALRAKHSSAGISSKLSTPNVFLGLKIKDPITPELPTGPVFASRPDRFGKSSYSIDLKIVEEPFALYFYRASEYMLLSAIYDPETVIDIYNQIDSLETNEFDYNRFNDLANLKFDQTNDSNGKIQFKEYDGYRLPNSFKESIESGDGTLLERLENAINYQFFGLTKNPIVYDLVKTNNNKLTSNSLPVLTDDNGRELDKNDNNYNAFPNAIKYTENNENFIRITDYTLDGAAAERYYYVAAEITREQKLGNRSLALGPVKLINSLPPESPYIQKYETVLASPYLEIPAGVRFYINPYLSIENVKKVGIFRTIDKSLSDNINLMTHVGDFDINNIYELVDNFEDLDFPPFGKDIYHRIVALREIKNELDEIEYIPSIPSELTVTKVVDNVNPPSPVINYTIGNTSNEVIQNISLSWDQTCYEGKYTLYKMSDVGFWQLVKSFNFNDSLSYNYTALNKQDEDGDTIYHRFKVVAENTGGLLSLNEEILVL